jgi:hypothetical protein
VRSSSLDLRYCYAESERGDDEKAHNIISLLADRVPEELGVITYESDSDRLGDLVAAILKSWALRT